MKILKKLASSKWLLQTITSQPRSMSNLTKLKFDNAVLRELPVDKEHGSRQRQVAGACFSLVNPTPVDNPKLVCYSASALELLGIKENDVTNCDFENYFSGNKIFEGSDTAAHCYCGHQFGHFSGQLGDGAAIYLGEIITDRNERWELQLKGAGLTPYSRHADGRKVLRSSIREFLCSEAMFYLGIPTTRAATCVTSDSHVVRDMFYDGNPKMEKCTIVSRIAPTFIRFGSFEIFKSQDPLTGRAGPSIHHKDILPQMLDYVIKYFYPEIAEMNAGNPKTMYLEFYKEIIRRTARLVAKWQCVGFCHGVLNTDNMSIVGVTIDYGPFGFMDFFDADHICNSSDTQGRYSYKKQPEICKWNLWKLGEAIRDHLPVPTQAKEALDTIYDAEFSTHYYEIMKKKLGLANIAEMKDDDAQLIQKLLFTMQRTSCDFTNTFCILMDNDLDSNVDLETVARELVKQCQNIEGMKKKFKSNVNLSQLMMLLQIANSEPQILAQLGMTKTQIEGMIAKAEKEKEVTQLTQSEKEEQDFEHWMSWLNLYLKRIEFESINGEESTKHQVMPPRKELMKKVNPRIILRNYMAQEAIDAAENGDFSKVQELLKFLANPYEFDSGYDSDKTSCRSAATKSVSCSPAWGTELRVS